jgi:hypothetical protein
VLCDSLSYDDWVAVITECVPSSLSRCVIQAGSMHWISTGRKSGGDCAERELEVILCVSVLV